MALRKSHQVTYRDAHQLHIICDILGVISNEGHYAATLLPYNHQGQHNYLFTLWSSCGLSGWTYVFQQDSALFHMTLAIQE